MSNVGYIMSVLMLFVSDTDRDTSNAITTTSKLFSFCHLKIKMEKNRTCFTQSSLNSEWGISTFSHLHSCRFALVCVGSEASSRKLMELLSKRELHGQNPIVTPCNKQSLSQFEMQSRKSKCKYFDIPVSLLNGGHWIHNLHA